VPEHPINTQPCRLSPHPKPELKPPPGCPQTPPPSVHCRRRLLQFPASTDRLGPLSASLLLIFFLRIFLTWSRICWCTRTSDSSPAEVHRRHLRLRRATGGEPRSSDHPYFATGPAATPSPLRYIRLSPPVLKSPRTTVADASLPSRGRRSNSGGKTAARIWSFRSGPSDLDLTATVL
jgi:hypothetical protein